MNIITLNEEILYSVNCQKIVKHGDLNGITIEKIRHGCWD